MSRDHASAEERFRCLYTKHVDPIRGFAMRRADQADRDVVGLGVFDRGPDEAQERDQDDEPSDDGSQRRFHLFHHSSFTPPWL